MEINRPKAAAGFAAYVKNYDVSDGKIRLKIEHTYKVAEDCKIGGLPAAAGGYGMAYRAFA